MQLQSTSLFERLSSRSCSSSSAASLGAADGRPTALGTVGLEDKADDEARELSGGQQQRLAIAIALVHDPEVVFLDEPTTGLDPQARRALWDVIRAIGAEGRTVVLTTHYLEEAEVLCERVAIMDGARIVALDEPRELVRALGPRSRVVFDAPGLDAARLGALPCVTRVRRRRGRFEIGTSDAQTTLAALLELAGREGVTLDHLAVVQPSLEDVFLELTGRELRE